MLMFEVLHSRRLNMIDHTKTSWPSERNISYQAILSCYQAQEQKKCQRLSNRMFDAMQVFIKLDQTRSNTIKRHMTKQGGQLLQCSNNDNTKQGSWFAFHLRAYKLQKNYVFVFFSFVFSYLFFHLSENISISERLLRAYMNGFRLVILCTSFYVPSLTDNIHIHQLEKNQ